VPSFADQLDPASPFSMTSKDHGLVGKLFLASEVLAAAKAIPQPIPLDKIQAAVDPTYLQKYLNSHPN
jgi:NitT/TauT family transport system substrate-binding protein